MLNFHKILFVYCLLGILNSGFVSAASDVTGYLDPSNCNYIYGWVCDADDYTIPLFVNFYDGPSSNGKLLGSAGANAAREAAVGKYCGGQTAHGIKWAVPSGVRDGAAHTIYAYAVNIPSSAEVSIGNARISGCSAGWTEKPKVAYGRPWVFANGKIDYQATEIAARALGVNTLTYVVWDSANENTLDGLKDFLANIDLNVWVMIMPSDNSKKMEITTGWAKALAQISLTHPNLTAFGNEDFRINSARGDDVTSASVKAMLAAKNAINPGLRYMPTLYFDGDSNPNFSDFENQSGLYYGDNKLLASDGLQLWYWGSFKNNFNSTIFNNYLNKTKNLISPWPFITGVYAVSHLANSSIYPLPSNVKFYSADEVRQMTAAALNNSNGVAVYELPLWVYGHNQSTIPHQAYDEATINKFKTAFYATAGALNGAAATACIPTVTDGCKYCKQDGSGWVSGCGDGQTCRNGKCEFSTTLTVDLNSVSAGGNITVFWQDVPMADIGDWIGVYKSGAANWWNRVDYKYISSCAQAKGSDAKSSGSCSFAIPLTWSGSYTARIFSSGNAAAIIAESQIFTVDSSSCTAQAFKKCESGKLYWYNSCDAKEGLFQDCGSDEITNSYRCNGSWTQRETIKKGCADNACGSAPEWKNETDCAAVGKVCSNGVCVTQSTDGGGTVIKKEEPKQIAKMTRDQILQKINEIVALIAKLQAQLKAITGQKYSCTQITKVLRYGMQNDPQVKCLQEVLQAQGYAIAVSGNYDLATKTAVKQFQEKYVSEILAPYGLRTGSGNVGNGTMNKLNQIMLGK